MCLHICERDNIENLYLCIQLAGHRHISAVWRALLLPLLRLVPSLSVETCGGENIWLRGLEDRLAETIQSQMWSKSGRKKKGAASGQILGLLEQNLTVLDGPGSVKAKLHTELLGFSFLIKHYDFTNVIRN